MHISVIVPCLKISQGIITGKNIREKISNALTNIEIEVIVVVDGYGKYSIKKLNKYLKVVTSERLLGSYKIRNLGTKFAKKESDFYIFVDEGVDIKIQLPFVLSNDIISGIVVFNQKPKNIYEKWYQINAFDNQKFLKKYKFLPTIFLIVPTSVFYKVGGFNENMFSSGDVEFCHKAQQFCNLVINPNIKIITTLRSKNAIYKKIKRQIYGQAYYAKVNKKYTYCLYIIIRIFYNLFGFSGSKVSPLSKDFFAYFLVNYKISLFKSFLLFNCLFLSEEKLYNKMLKANKAEILFTENITREKK